VTLAWNPLRFHLVEALPKGRIFNAEYYPDNILTALIQLLPDPGGRKLGICASNSRPQTAQKCRRFYPGNGLRLATDPLHLLDLEPSDFFLFRHVKNHLEGIVFQSHEKLLAGILGVLGLILIKTLQCVFEDSMETLEWASQKNGDYYP
jgi:hypothetical protein